MPCLQVSSLLQPKRMLFYAILGVLYEFALTSDYFESRKLSSDDIKKAQGLALYIRTRREWDKTNNPNQRTAPQQPWYTKVQATETRFEPVGTMFIIKIKQAQKPTGSRPDWNFEIEGTQGCTAFYVAPTVLATAAHCFWDAEVTPDSKHEIIFRQHYDGRNAYTTAEAGTHERVITEWVYPKKFQRKEKGGNPWCRATGYDYAFMRTHAAKHGNDVYKIIDPNDIIKGKAFKQLPQLLLVGYPLEFAEYREMVTVSCKLHSLVEDTSGERDPDVIKDLGVADSLKKGQMLEIIDDKQIFCISDKGNMQKGGSGGPWMLAPAALPTDAKQKSEQSLWVLGISSWSYERDPVPEVVKGDAYEKKFLENQKQCLATASGKLRAKDVARYEEVINSKPTDSILDILDAALKKEHIAC